MKPSFITGCKSYNIDAITKHEESKINLRSREIKAQLQKPIKKSDAAKVLCSSNKSNTEKLFKTCHALVLKNRPLSDFLQNRDAYMHMSCWNK